MRSYVYSYFHGILKHENPTLSVSNQYVLGELNPTPNFREAIFVFEGKIWEFLHLSFCGILEAMYIVREVFSHTFKRGTSTMTQKSVFCYHKLFKKEVSHLFGRMIPVTNPDSALVSELAARTFLHKFDLFSLA